MKPAVTVPHWQCQWPGPGASTTSLASTQPEATSMLIRGPGRRGSEIPRALARLSRMDADRRTLDISPQAAVLLGSGLRVGWQLELEAALRKTLNKGTSLFCCTEAA